MLLGIASLCAALPASGGDAQVSIVDFAFNPASVSINVNDSVTWTWIGPSPHTTTSNTRLWDSGLLGAAAPQFTYTFKSAGSFPYFCAVHPFMQASVTVNAVVVLDADLGISMTAVPNPVLVSNQLTYSLVINNAGPADAPDVMVTDNLPGSVLFLSATTSQGTATQNGGVWRWDAGPLVKGSSATGMVTVVALAAGTLLNAGSVSINSATVIDPNPANNNASIAITVNGPNSTNLSVHVLGPILFDPQTGLFEEPVRFSNLNGTSIPAVRLAVLGLPPDVALYNASGSVNGQPFVEYDQQVAPGASVDFLLEYYRSNRLDFVSTNFAATVVAPTVPSPATGKVVQLDRSPFVFNGRVVIEFASIPGQSYVVEYSADMLSWSAAVPSLIAAGTRVQWIDAGPPKTASAPGLTGKRFYRIVLLP